MKGKEKSNYLKIEKIYADRFLKLLKKRLGSDIALDNKRLILYEGDYVEFPINTNKFKKRYLKKIIRNNFEFEFILRKTVYNPKFKYKNLKEALELDD